MGLFKKTSKYLSAAANDEFDKRADPRIQIEQAVEEAQHRHAELAQHAAEVIGNVRQVEMRLARAIQQSDRLQNDARQALVMADQARASDPTKAASYEEAAQTIAGQLVAVEASVETLKAQRESAGVAAEQAKKIVQTDTAHLNQVLAQRTELLTQLQSAQMQETVAKNLQLASDLSAPGDVPTLDAVRDKIEARYATAMGTSELGNDSVAGRVAEVEQASMDVAAQSRLDQIRASLGSGDAPQLSGADAQKQLPS